MRLMESGLQDPYVEAEMDVLMSGGRCDSIEVQELALTRLQRAITPIPEGAESYDEEPPREGDPLTEGEQQNVGQQQTHGVEEEQWIGRRE